MKRVALTGGIATGKTHVRAEFERLGVPTIDADKLARDAVADGSPGLKAVISRFGHGVLDDTGALDRRMLGSIVFQDPVARRDLEDIIHPAVRRAIDDWFASLEDKTPHFAIADIPLLFETAGHERVDAVVTVSAPAEVQRARLLQRPEMTDEKLEALIANQLPDAEKRRRSRRDTRRNP